MEVSGQLLAPSALPSEKDLPLLIETRRLGPWAGMEALEKAENSCPCWESNYDSPDVSPVSQLLYRLHTVPFRDLKLRDVFIPIHKQIIRVMYVLRSRAYLYE